MDRDIILFCSVSITENLEIFAFLLRKTPGCNLMLQTGVFFLNTILRKIRNFPPKNFTFAIFQSGFWSQLVFIL